MVAPVYIAASTGATDAGGAWTATCHAPGAAGRVIILQVLQDGATSGAVAVTGSTNINNLAGSAGWTSIGSFAVGSATAAYQHLWIGRSTGTSAPTASGTNSTSEDLYWRFYEFNNGSTGTTLATVIENGTAGATANEVGTSSTAADAGVTTLGSDRLALNFVAVNDDNAIAEFSGEAGGEWSLLGTYAESSGTDGAVGLQVGYTGHIHWPSTSSALVVYGSGGIGEAEAQSFTVDAAATAT